MATYAEQALNDLITSVRKTLADAIQADLSEGSYEAALQRENEQGALDVLLHYADLAGFSVQEEAFCECEQNCLKKQCLMTGLMIKHCPCVHCVARKDEVALAAFKTITVTRS